MPRRCRARRGLGQRAAAAGAVAKLRTSSPTTQSTFGGRAAQASRSALARRGLPLCRGRLARCASLSCLGRSVRRSACCASPSGAGQRARRSARWSFGESQRHRQPEEEPDGERSDEPHRRDSPRMQPRAHRQQAQRYGDKQQHDPQASGINDGQRRSERKNSQWRGLLSADLAWPPR